MAKMVLRKKCGLPETNRDRTCPENVQEQVTGFPGA